MSIQEIKDYQLEKLNAYNRPWLSVSECAGVLDLSDTGARSAIEKGKLEAIQHKKGGRILVTKTSVIKYIDDLEAAVSRG